MLRAGRASLAGCGMLRGLYDWVMGLAARKDATWALAVVSFVESSFFPIPPDAMLIPMVLAQRRRAWLIAGVCTVASVLGGFLGYAIGYFLFETVGRWVIDAYGLQQQFERYVAMYNHYGLWIILIKGMTPIPYKLITIASGVARFDLAVFAAASIVTRAARFFMVAALLYWFGPPIKEFIERRLTLVTTAFLIAVIGGFVVVRYVM
jgi:membrane protein YqaA with SNARE-associated domain